jgi:membrane-bound lytic murein transglycosylase D
MEERIPRMTPRLALLPTLVVAALLTACQTGAMRTAPGTPPSSTAQPDPVANPTPAQPMEDPVTAEDLPPVDLPADKASGAVVFARLERQLTPGACDTGAASAQWRKRYAPSPRAFAGHIEKILPLLDFVTREVESGDLPGEYALIPIIESWYQPDAIGSGGPAGMWQMIGSTARNHGVRIQSGYDGRLSPVESTRAALSYLKTLQRMFGGWQPTVMAYNAGEGRILNAFKRNGSREASAAKRLPKGLSHITYAYIDKLNALSCLLSEPERNNLRLPTESRFVPLAPILVDADLRSLDEVARRHRQSAAALRELNPGYKGGKIAAGVPRLVLMPGAPMTAFAAIEESATPDPASEPVATDGSPPRTHRVGDGDSLWSIAKRYRLSIAQLLRLNQLGKKAVIRPGQQLKLSP